MWELRLPLAGELPQRAALSDVERRAVIGRHGDLFEQRDVDAICITTNGAVRKDGAAVMGRGCAAETARRWPVIQYILGADLAQHGNVAQLLTGDYGRPSNAVPMLWHPEVVGGSPDADGVVLPWHVVAFPVKHHWRDQADFALIEKSARELVMLTDKRGWNRVALVRPGCGNGGRSWDDVRPLIEPILDDRFIVVQR